MIEPYEETINGVLYRIIFEVRLTNDTPTYPATVWRNDAGDWHIAFTSAGGQTRAASIASCIQRMLHDAHDHRLAP